jgi:serine protease AprX
MFSRLQGRTAGVDPSPPARRFKVRFPELDALREARAIELPGTELRLVNEKRRFFCVQLPAQGTGRLGTERLLDSHLHFYERHFAAGIVADFQYDLEAAVCEERADLDRGSSLQDVLTLIRAREAWEISRGAGATIAVVDTGVDGTRPELPLNKRAGGWAPPGENPWTDWEGHGTMCACIAAGNSAFGGRCDGVAPDAGLISCRTHFYDSELATAYDYLIERATRDGLRIVATNSFGLLTGTPPSDPVDSDFLPALGEAIDRGILVCFSAGNNHVLARNPQRCAPNTIWLYKSRADVLAVAACDLEGELWASSSRGPGQRFGQPNTSRKPDVTAPTPHSGRILGGVLESTVPGGWGTSGACAQVAGLAALLAALHPDLSRASTFDAIRDTATDLGLEWSCQGAGRIDCWAAVSSLA